MGDIYKTWVDFGIDGFRIDTVKHVNLEFWQKFIPDILGEAKRVGNDDFFAFGEVYDGNPEVMSQYTTSGKLQATLDFGFQQQGVDFAKGKPANVLADFFSRDDWYTDADSNAYQSPTFLGNHDMGRAAMFLQDSAANDAELMQRVKFANALMFTTRGNPVTYYGDEQGFIGTGGDQLAREDMFASKVDIYNNEKVLGGPSGSMDRYNTKAPLYTWIKALSAARAEHPALADGAQINRYAAEGSGLFVVSRYDRDSRREYVVAANNATTPQTVTIDTWTKQGNFKPVLGTDAKVKSGHDGAMTVTVPPLTVSVWAGNKPIDGKVAAPTSTLAIAPGATVSGRQEVRRRRHELAPSRRRPSSIARAWARRTGSSSGPTTTLPSGSSTTSRACRWARFSSTAPSRKRRGRSGDSRQWILGGRRPRPRSAAARSRTVTR
jgi:hypothetical protein